MPCERDCRYHSTIISWRARERQQVTSPSSGRETTGYEPFDRERDNRLRALRARERDNRLRALRPAVHPTVSCNRPFICYHHTRAFAEDVVGIGRTRRYRVSTIRHRYMYWCQSPCLHPQWMPLSVDYIHTVEFDPFIKSQLTARNQLQGLMWCKFGQVTLKI